MFDDKTQEFVDAKQKLRLIFYLMNMFALCVLIFDIRILDQIKQFAYQLLGQFFFCDPVVLESICNRARAYQLINESNRTGGLGKIWKGYQNISSHMTIEVKLSQFLDKKLLTWVS